MKLSIKGLYTAIITPFNESGELDEYGFRENLRFQIHHKVDGIVVLGTTGEAPTLTHSEKRRIIEIAVEEVKGNAILLVGTGSYCTRTAIEQTKEAKAAGADGALIVTPYYNKPTQEGLYRHFAAICEAVEFPICVYNISGRTGQNLQTETLQRLMKFPSIISVKEASGNISQMSDVIVCAKEHSPHLTILSGDDAITLPLIALGGHGVISVVSNVLPGPMNKLVLAALTGDFDTARSIHRNLSPFFKAAFIETNPIPIKAAMQLCGMAAGPCRLPLCDIEPHHLIQLGKALQRVQNNTIVFSEYKNKHLA